MPLYRNGSPLIELTGSVFGSVAELEVDGLLPRITHERRETKVYRRQQLTHIFKPH